LWPTDISAGQITQVTVENKGNTSETFTIIPNPEQKLSITPSLAKFTLDVGQSKTTDFRVTPPQQWVVVLCNTPSHLQ